MHSQRSMQATMICVDDSVWMLKEDYPPTRLQAQADAANLVFATKMAVRLQPRVHTIFGVFFLTPGVFGGVVFVAVESGEHGRVPAMAGDRVRVLLALTSDPVKFLACMHGA